MSSHQSSRIAAHRPSTFLLAAASGARSMTPAAMLAHVLARRAATRDERDATRSPRPGNGPAAWLARPAVARTLAVLAAGELVGDKLPSAPDRIAAGPLLGRGLLGALVGGAAAQLARRPVRLGAVTGATAAVAAAHVTYRARRSLGRRLGVPDALVALAEDALVLLATRAAVRAIDAAGDASVPHTAAD